MTELIKQRLVGVLIMVIAGVVFIPDLLDGEKQLTKEEFRKIPPKPELKTQPIITEFPEEQVLSVLEKAPLPAKDTAIDDDKPASSQQAKVKEQTTLVKEVNASAPKPLKPTPKPQYAKQVKPSAQFQKQLWVLRLGSFRNKPNVDALIAKLEDAGVQTFVKPVKAKAGMLYRVFVGPKENKNQLFEAQKTLKELTGLNGQITQFDPIN